MAEHLEVDRSGGRASVYRSLHPQLEALVSGEPDLVANVANVVAALREALGFFWVGVYFVKGDSLVLGPFQGPIACTRIARGRGVCGHAWQTAQSVRVPDVEKFPGHIACSSLARSEVVVPVFARGGEVVMVLDVDSDRLEDFSELDVVELERVAALLGRLA